MRLILAMTLLSLSSLAYADTSFIEGFPDVPLLDGVSENATDRVVFDTPSGTVAETTLTTKTDRQVILSAYEADLPELGWQCHRGTTSLTCQREEDRLVFSLADDAGPDDRIILRLEPKG